MVSRFSDGGVTVNKKYILKTIVVESAHMAQLAFHRLATIKEIGWCQRAFYLLKKWFS